MERDSFVFYRSFYEAIKLQPKKYQAEIYNTIAEYALNGNEPTEDSPAKGIFLLVKPQIDANNKKYQNGKKGAEHGAKGGRPKAEETPKGLPEGEEEKPLRGYEVSEHETPNVNVNDNVNVNENENDNANEKENEKNNYQLIADMYNATCVSFPKCTTLSEKRKKALKARLTKYGIDDFKTLFEKAEQSEFLKGANDRNWSATFDWLIADGNMVKVLDGNYENRESQPQKAKPVKSRFNNFTPRSDIDFEAIEQMERKERDKW